MMDRMAKFLCRCGSVVRTSGAIPNPAELLLISDVKYDEFHGEVNAEALYREMTHAFRCSTCGRLWIYWDGMESVPTEYAPS